DDLVTGVQTCALPILGGDEDCRNFDAVAYEMLLKLQAVHLRHLKIDNQAHGKVSWQRREKLRSRSVSLGTKSARTQQATQGLERSEERRVGKERRAER